MNTDTGHLAWLLVHQECDVVCLISDPAGQHRVQVKGFQTNLQDSTQTQSRLIPVSVEH